MEEKNMRINKKTSALRLVWDKMNEKRKTLYLYTFLFLFIFFISFSPFLLEKKSFICIFDGGETIFQDHIFFGKWIREIFSNFAHGTFTIPLYDFSKGWGSRIIELGIDPLVIVMAPFFTVTNGEFLYTILIVLRLYFAGLSYLYMCRYFQKEKLAALAGCFVYLFSAYMIYAGLAFPSYIMPMIQLPLLVVGTEKILRKEQSTGFVFAVMFTAVCGYYHLYIQTILICIYCIVRLFSIYPNGERLKVLPGILECGIGKWLLGLGLSAFITLPAILGFSSAARSGFRNISISNSIATHWHYFWIRMMSLISPIKHFEWDWGMDYPAFPAIFLLCAVVILTTGTKKKYTQKLLLGISLFMLFCPWCGLVMNGFQYSCNRWVFGFTLFAGYLITDTIPDLFQMNSAQKKASIAAAIFYGCITLFSAEVNENVCTWVGTAFLAATLLLIIPRNIALKKTLRFKYLLCLGLICLNICCNALYLNYPGAMGWSAKFLPLGFKTASLLYGVEGEPSYSPYGYEVRKGRIDSTYLYYHDSIVYSQPGTNIYTPLLNSNIVDFRNAIEGSGNVQYFKIFSSDQRTILNSLLSVDQQFERNETVKYVPYGYSYCGDTAHGYKVYQNDYSLGWGYTYDHSAAYDEIKNLNGIDMQEVMLHSVILDKDKQIKKSPIEIRNVRIPYTYQCVGCTWDNGIVSAGNNAIIRLTADLPGGKEYYIRIKGFKIDGYGDKYLTISTGASFNIIAKSGGVTKYGRAMDRSYPWYYGRENYLFCLGYLKEDRNLVEFQIPRSGIFRLEDIEIYALPLEHYPKQAEKLRQESLRNVVLGTNQLSGTIDITGNKVLIVTVPYETGWTAYVDGNETEILKANYAFMGLHLTEGHHDIVFRYHVPYLTEGIIISLISLGITIVIIVRGKRRLKEQN